MAMPAAIRRAALRVNNQLVLLLLSIFIICFLTSRHFTPESEHYGAAVGMPVSSPACDCIRHCATSCVRPANKK
jgi:hypothetical protein